MSLMGVGVHSSHVVSHQLGRSSKGTPHVAVLFENEEGEHITWYGYLSDAALEYTLATLAVLGWDPIENDARVDTLNGTELLVGAQADLVIETEEYNGEHRPKVKWVNRPGGGLGEGMAAEDANAFAVSLRQKILSAQRPKPNAAPGAAKPAAKPAARTPARAGAGSRPLSQPDDDLPF